MKTNLIISGAKKRILHIEDSRDSGKIVALVLCQAGYEVISALTIEEGLNLAGLERVDLYILGSRFTHGTGLELCRQIRALDRLTPIIFFSGAAHTCDIEAGMAAGAQH